MAFEVPDFNLPTLTAASTAYSLKQYHCMVASSSDNIAVTPSDSASMTGIMQNAPTNTGEEINLAVSGVSKAVYGTALTAGDNFIVGTSGRVASTAGAGAGAFIYGQVLVTGASSAIGSVLVNPLGIST